MRWWVAWFVALAVLTVGLLSIRDRLQSVHAVLPFLLVVLGGSASGGRSLGLALSAVAFIDLHYFFLPYQDSLVMADPLDWIVLVTFLVTSIVAAHLTTQADRRAREARARGAEAEIYRRADALKESLIATLSHDLRTPLTTIKALGSKLAGRGESEGRVIEEEADRLNRLVTDLLDLSRLNARSMPLRLELNMAADLVGAAMQRVSGHADDGRVRIVNGNGASDLAGTFDLVQSVRALANLVENAVKYSPPGMPVEVSFGRQGGHLWFQVTDRGPGVPPSEQEKVFAPFYRAPGVAPDVGGAGLGLAIASRLAAEQGGAIRYRDRPGGGSIFTLLLPAAVVPEQAGTGPELEV
jgi:two-component system sensor histidine kinase KdpD